MDSIYATDQSLYRTPSRKTAKESATEHQQVCVADSCCSCQTIGISARLRVRLSECRDTHRMAVCSIFIRATAGCTNARRKSIGTSSTASTVCYDSIGLDTISEPCSAAGRSCTRYYTRNSRFGSRPPLSVERCLLCCTYNDIPLTLVPLLFPLVCSLSHL